MNSKIHIVVECFRFKESCLLSIKGKEVYQNPSTDSKISINIVFVFCFFVFYNTNLVIRLQKISVFLFVDLADVTLILQSGATMLATFLTGVKHCLLQYLMICTLYVDF